MKKFYPGPTQYLSSFGPSVAHLWLFSVLSNVGMGVAVVGVAVDSMEKVGGEVRGREGGSVKGDVDVVCF